MELAVMGEYREFRTFLQSPSGPQVQGNKHLLQTPRCPSVMDHLRYAGRLPPIASGLAFVAFCQQFLFLVQPHMIEYKIDSIQGRLRLLNG